MRKSSDAAGTIHLAGLALFWLLLFATPASAEMAEATLDSIANALAWLVLFVAPVVGIAGFLTIHVLPEKFAEKRRHPQLAAIKTLCWVSLIFGGLLWPFCWVWAFSKPVLYKRAYGTDVLEEDESHENRLKQSTPDETASQTGI